MIGGMSIRPLGPNEPRSTLAHRLSSVVDRVRQIPTRLGTRSKRVFLVWSHWTGDIRGEGDEFVLARVELLPTPIVSDLSGVSWRPYSIGTFAEGSVRVSEISVGAYTYDMLSGLVIPKQAARDVCGACGPVAPLQGQVVRKSGPCLSERTTAGDVDFWWEIVEDGRGDQLPVRTRYRLSGVPSRDEENVQWVANLEAASEALSRKGETQIGPDASTVNNEEDET